MRTVIVLAAVVLLSGCVETSQEQRCYEARKAVAESNERAARIRDASIRAALSKESYILDEFKWREAESSAKQWVEAECTSWGSKLLKKWAWYMR